MIILYFSVALNVNIQEFVDMCAISADGRIRVITNDHGFRGETIETCVILLGTGDIPATIRVASSNAQPVARGIFFTLILYQGNEQGTEGSKFTWLIFTD